MSRSRDKKSQFIKLPWKLTLERECATLKPWNLYIFAISLSSLAFFLQLEQQELTNAGPSARVGCGIVFIMATIVLNSSECK